MGAFSSAQRKRLTRLADDHDRTAELKAGFCNADPITTQGKRIQIGQLVMATVIPIALLLCLLTAEMAWKVQIYRENSSTLKQMKVFDEIYTINRILQDDWINLKETSVETQASIGQKNIEDLPWLIGAWVGANSMLSSKAKFLSTFESTQEAILNGSISAGDVLDIHADVYNDLYIAMTAIVKDIEHSTISLRALVLQELLSVQHSLLVEEEIGSIFFETGSLSPEDVVLFIQEIAGKKNSIKVCVSHSVVCNSEVAQFLNKYPRIETTVEKFEQDILNGRINNETGNVSKEWEKMFKIYMIFALNTWQAIYSNTVADLEEDVGRWQFEKASLIIAQCSCVVLSVPLVYVIWLITSLSQKYATSLTHKTRQLRRDKKTSDTLLYQMLPKSVALQLKMSRRVSAELYNSASVYFSDIVGFTSISARSTPMQVVDFLNTLYHFFDTTIERHDVYKVETIGDAYMVTSGVPQRNGKRHVGEISALSLELLEGVRVFRIPHMPEEQLRLRIGLHTGSVVAGVVGQRMPRYCLFGETVSIASAMESTGIPMKIHLSKDCKEKLDQLGNYATEKRGTILIKGVEMETHFLLAKGSSHVTSLHDQSSILNCNEEMRNSADCNPANVQTPRWSKIATVNGQSPHVSKSEKAYGNKYEFAKQENFHGNGLNGKGVSRSRVQSPHGSEYCYDNKKSPHRSGIPDIQSPHRSGTPSLFLVSIESMTHE